jgi:hypothetical protein
MGKVSVMVWEGVSVEQPDIVLHGTMRRTLVSLHSFLNPPPPVLLPVSVRIKCSGASTLAPELGASLG